MCALIRDSATDPLVQQCAAYAKKHFACGSDDPAALAWGVFWYVKHCVKFRSDEGTMMQIGEHALDLLTAPAVLVRMRNPSEDCDGFTMLSSAMLTILDVQVLVTTVATDLDDPRRWSHVFLCAIVNGRVMPLDTSHGKAPGWMVPRDRINRFQTWTLDGRRANVQIPNYQGLHGYTRSGIGAPGGGRRIIPIPQFVRGRGFGACGDCTTWAPDTSDESGNLTPGGCISYDTASCGTPSPDQPGITIPFSGGLPSGTPPTGGAYPGALTPAQAGLTPAQQAQLIAAVGNSAVSLIRTAAGGPYTVAGTNLVYNPATGQLSSVTSPLGLNVSTLNMSSIMNNLPLIGGAVIAFFLISQIGKK